MYEEQSDMHEEERDSSHKIIAHIEKRFSELEAILENNPDTKIIIAGRIDKLGQPSNLDI